MMTEFYYNKDNFHGNVLIYASNVKSSGTQKTARKVINILMRCPAFLEKEI
jgi:hypothetical protein